MRVLIGAWALLLPLLAAALLPHAAAAAPVPFAALFHAQDNGEIALMANTLETCPAAPPDCTNARLGTGPLLNNNDYTMILVNRDGQPTSFDSSSADVSLPSGATVLSAFLFWGARRDAGSGGLPAASFGSFSSMRLATPVIPTSAYQTITAPLAQCAFITTGTVGSPYQCYADVTTLVGAGGSGTYWGSNVAAATGSDRYAGWSIAVAYRDPAAPLRDLAIFAGFDNLGSGKTSVAIGLSGFVAPLFGPVRTTIGVVAYEGDLATKGDSFKLNGTTLSDAANPPNNFFNSTISRFGSNVTTRNPNDINNFDFDAKLLDAGGSIPNGATSATATLGTVGDAIYPGAVTTAIDLFAPAFPPVTKSVVDLTRNTTPAQPGDTLEYTLAYQNLGLDAATGCVVRDRLPQNTTFVPGSIAVLTGANAGPKTDAAGDDQAEYVSATRTVVARVGTGANATAGGRLVPNESTSLSFKVTVDAAAAGTTLTNTATLDYVAQTIGRAFTYTGNTVATPVASPGPPPPPPTEADVAVVKRAPQLDAVPGAPVTFDIDVINDGPAIATSVVLTDTLPPQTTFVSVTSNDPSIACGAGGGVLTCNLGTIPVGQIETFRVTVTAPPTAVTGTLTDIASVTSATTDPNPSNNSSSATVPLVPIASLTITEAAAPAQPAVGDTVTETITITNGGPSEALGVTLTDQLPAGVSFVSATPSSGSCTLTTTPTPTDATPIPPGPSGTLSCSLGDIPVGATVTVRVLVRDNVAGTVTNTVSVSSLSLDPNPSSTATASVSAVAVAPPATGSPLGRTTLVAATLSGLGLVLLALAARPYRRGAARMR